MVQTVLWGFETGWVSPELAEDVEVVRRHQGLEEEPGETC